MPMDFPDFESLRMRAKDRNFRQPLDGETEQQYRDAFAIFMADIDLVESMEISAKVGWDLWPSND